MRTPGLTAETGRGAAPEAAAPTDGLFRASFESCPAPAYVWKREGEDFVLVAHNAAAARLAAYAEPPLATRASVFFKDRPDIVNALRRCVEARETVVQEVNVSLTLGASRRLRMTRVPLSGDVVVVYAEDVTKHRDSVIARKVSDERFRALFESNPDLIFRMDVDGTYLDVHVPDGAVLACRPDELIGRHIRELFGEEGAARHRHYAREAVRTGEVQIIEYDVKIGDKTIFVESRIVRSGPNEVVVNVRDITERVTLAEAVSDAQERERSRLGRMLHRELRLFRAGLRALRESSASHHGPELMPTPAESARVLADLEALVERADDLVNDLCPIPEGTSVGAALAALAARMQSLFAVSCRLFPGAGVPELTEHVPDLYELAHEAIASAVQQGRAKQVEIIYTVVDDRFILSIADDGTEFRLLASENAALSARIMQHRASRLGGTLTRSRRAGGGTRITCTCPVRNLAAMPPRAPAATSESTGASGATHPSPRTNVRAKSEPPKASAPTASSSTTDAPQSVAG